MVDLKSSSPGERLVALSVHAYTALGVVCAFLAIKALDARAYDTMYLWMLVAVIVDATDGFLARRFRVKDVLPEIDGALLDNIIDFLNFTLVPVLFLYQSGWLLEPAWLWCSCILVASLFAFVNTGAKSSEFGFFRGFPSYWNIVVFLVDISLRQWALKPTDEVRLGVTLLVVFLAILSLLPVYFIYPSRAVRWPVFFMIGGFVWTVQLGLCLVSYPQISPELFYSSLIFPFIYLVMSAVWTPSIHRQVKG